MCARMCVCVCVHACVCALLVTHEPKLANYLLVYANRKIGHKENRTYQMSIKIGPFSNICVHR
jgi:type IV secretory pathway VirB3-like protein